MNCLLDYQGSLPHFRRCLWSLARQVQPPCHLVLLGIEEWSEAHQEVLLYSPYFAISCCSSRHTIRNHLGKRTFLLSSSVILGPNCLEQMQGQDGVVLAQAYQLDPNSELSLDDYGGNFGQKHREASYQRPVQTEFYDKKNFTYLSVARAEIWEQYFLELRYPTRFMHSQAECFIQRIP